MGAERRGEKVTRFIVDSACAAAEMALADQRQFQLSPAQFERFQRIIPALKKLFAEETVLDRNRKTASRGRGAAQS